MLFAFVSASQLVSVPADRLPIVSDLISMSPITAFTHQPSGETNKQEVIMEEIWVGLDFSPGTWFFLLRRGVLLGACAWDGGVMVGWGAVHHVTELEQGDSPCFSVGAS